MAKRNILFINWGTRDKAYTLEAAQKKKLNIYMATTADYPTWVEEYVPKKNIIITNPYDSEILIIDVVTFLNCQSITLDGVTTFFEMNIIQTADLAAALNLPFLSPGAARRSSGNKLLMRDVCMKNGILTPKFRTFTNQKEGLKYLKEFDSPVVIKPVKSGHSYGVCKIEGKTRKELIKDFVDKYRLARKHLNDNFDEWMKYYNLYKKYFLIEEYIEGKVISVDGLIQNGQEIFSSVSEFELSPEPLFLQWATFIPAHLSIKLEKDYKKVAWKIIKTLGFDNCGFHCEIRLSKKGPMLLEVAARLPGGQMLTGYRSSYGIDLADLYLDICLGKEISLPKVNLRRYVLQESFPQLIQGTITKIDGLDKLSQMKEFTLFETLKIGQSAIFTSRVPCNSIYYQLVSDSPKKLLSLRNEVKKIFKLEVRKDTRFYLRLIKRSIKNIIRSSG